MLTKSLCAVRPQGYGICQAGELAMKRLGITNTGTVVLPLIDLSLVLVVVCGESATATPEPTERPCRPGTSVPTCPFRRAGQGTGQLTTAPLRSDLLNRPRCQPRSRPLPLSPPLPEQLAPRGHSTPASERSIPMPLTPACPAPFRPSSWAAA